MWKNWSDAEWTDFKKRLKGQYVESPREEWMDWTKKEWIEHQIPEEQRRLVTLSEDESDDEFIRWMRKKVIEKLKAEDELRAQGILPPLKEIPQYGNRPVAITNYYDSSGQYVGYGASYGDN